MMETNRLILIFISNMVEVSRIAKENGIRPVLIEKKFTNSVLYNLFGAKNCKIVCTNVQQTIVSVFLYLNSVKVYWQLSVNVQILR